MSIIVKIDQLNLPLEIAEKLKGKKMELLETEEGLLLRPLQGDPIKELSAGILFWLIQEENEVS